MLELIPLAIWDDFLGFLNTLMTPIYWAISGTIVGFHWLFSQFMDFNSGWTWALSIIALTVVVRTLMIPLFVRQINSSRKMQLVAPKARAVQEKWAHDRERQGPGGRRDRGSGACRDDTPDGSTRHAEPVRGNASSVCGAPGRRLA